jgi:hypothetical protein
MYNKQQTYVNDVTYEISKNSREDRPGISQPQKGKYSDFKAKPKMFVVSPQLPT